MKGHLSFVCALLVLALACGASYGADQPTKGLQQPGAMQQQNVPSATGAGSAAKNQGVAQPGVPSAVGAGPGVSAGAMGPIQGTTMTTDNNFVYVLQEGKLYRFPKSSLNMCGTAVAGVCGAGPGCPTCSGMTFIPGFASSQCTVTTTTPCQPACPPVGAGPCDPCNVPKQVCPTTIVRCTPMVPQACLPCKTPKCDPCNPCDKCRQTMTYNSTTSTMQCAPIGAGPCACPAVAAVDACGQAFVDCVNAACGADADKAYLQSMVQLNQSILALSDASAVYLGKTSLQNWATNSIADSKSRVSTSIRYLKDKYCLTVAACPPNLSPGLNICDVRAKGSQFDQAYVDQLVQYYVDEIALSQAEIDRGLDCQVKVFAAEVIKQDQIRIQRLRRCGACI